MSVDMATSITRKLRKLYAVTQKNMDLLDRAIVESFVENFPTESTRIHMGRMAPQDPPSPVKRSRAAAFKNKKGSKTKVKITGKKKGGRAGSGGRPGPAKTGGAGPGRKKKFIQMNGSPVYRDADEIVVPGLKKKRKKGYNESDDDVIEVSDEEFYNPKKKSRPGPASKKGGGRPGPASKKKIGPKSKMYN